MLLLVDNRDSFTFNLAQALQAEGADVHVRPAASLSLRNVLALDPRSIVLGPGPGPPELARLSIEIVQRLSGRRPILGVCLGHQVLGAVFGLRTVRSNDPVHGRPVAIEHDGRGLFEGLPQPVRMARYNSLTIDRSEIPDVLEVSARDEKGAIMGLRHVEHPTASVQFHPESVVSEAGTQLIRNFLAIADRYNTERALAPSSEELPLDE